MAAAPPQGREHPKIDRGVPRIEQDNLSILARQVGAVTLSSLGLAFSDVLVDAMVVARSRGADQARNPNHAGLKDEFSFDGLVEPPPHSAKPGLCSV